MGVMMALDVGEKRIGVATSDALGIIATPVTTVHREGAAQAVSDIAGLVRDYAAETLVVGLPITLRNTHSRQTQKVTSFVDKLKDALDIPVVVWDERLTTAEATRILRGPDDRRRRGSSTKRQRSVKENVDQVAAALILEAYMAAHPNRAASPVTEDA